MLALIVPKFVGLTNLELGMLSVPAMTPIIAVLHDPPATCAPFVRGLLIVRQKFMKLLNEVAEGTWPAVAFACPSCSKPVDMTRGSKAAKVGQTIQVSVMSD